MTSDEGHFDGEFGDESPEEGQNPEPQPDLHRPLPQDITDRDFLEARVTSDNKGRINIRIPEALKQEIENICDDRKIPLETVSDVVRFGLYTGIRRINSWTPRKTLLGMLAQANAVLSNEKLQREHEEFVHRCDGQIKWYIDHKEYDEAISFAANARTVFEYGEDNFWKQFYIKEIDKKIESWIEQIDKAKQGDERAKGADGIRK